MIKKRGLFRPLLLYCFRSDYEGWKPLQSFHYSGELYNFGFRSDYEGWKPTKTITVSPSGKVLEVTMRDGNFTEKLFARTNLLIPVLEVTMRDGNLAVRGYLENDLCYEVLEVTMRDGNIPRINCVTKCVHSFRSDYEGWKQV